MLIFIGVILIVGAIFAWKKGSNNNFETDTRGLVAVVFVLACCFIVAGAMIIPEERAESAKTEDVEHVAVSTNDFTGLKSFTERQKPDVIENVVIKNTSYEAEESKKEITKDDYDEDLLQSIFLSAKENFDGSFDIELDRENKTFRFIPTDDDISKALLLMLANPTTELKTSWDNIVKSFQTSSSTISDSLPGYMISIVNPYNKENTLLMLSFGVVIYNFAE